MGEGAHNKSFGIFHLNDFYLVIVPCHAANLKKILRVDI